MMGEEVLPRPRSSWSCRRSGGTGGKVRQLVLVEDDAGNRPRVAAPMASPACRGLKGGDGPLPRAAVGKGNDVPEGRQRPQLQAGKPGSRGGKEIRVQNVAGLLRLCGTACCPGVRRRFGGKVFMLGEERSRRAGVLGRQAGEGRLVGVDALLFGGQGC